MFYVNYLQHAQLADESAVQNVEAPPAVIEQGESVGLNESQWPNQYFDVSDRDFVKSYRLTKIQACELIHLIGPLMKKPQRIDGFDPSIKIMVSLSFYATGSYQTIVGQCHSMSQPSVSRAINEVTEVLNRPEIFLKFVKFPGSREEREEVIKGFYQKFHIPGALGAIDGTQIAIVTPTEHEERYFNRKGYHSLNTIVICDSAARILAVDPSNPGSTHDSMAWSFNPLSQKLATLIEEGEDFFLLGDSGFPLRRSMMTPILETQNSTPEAFYTEIHAGARNVVERCIGILKERFRCLLIDRRLHYAPKVAAKIVNACCVLHNIALKNTDMNQANVMQPHPEMILTQAQTTTLRRHANNDLEIGRNYQAHLVARIWNQRHIVDRA